MSFTTLIFIALIVWMVWMHTAGRSRRLRRPRVAHGW